MARDNCGINLSSLGGSFNFMNFLLEGISIQAGAYAYPSVLNPDGYPQSVPSTTIFGTVLLPSTYVGDWVIDWTGTLGTGGVAGFQLGRGVGGFTVVSGGGFVVGATTFNLNLTGTNGSVQFNFAGAGVGSVSWNWLSTGVGLSGVSNMRLYRIADQAALNAGDIFNPDFIAVLQQLNPGFIRPLNWTNVNNSNRSLYAYRTPSTAFSYANPTWATDAVTGAWVGTITGTDTYSCSAPPNNPGDWTDKQVFQGQFTNANTSTTPTLSVAGYTGSKTIVTGGAAALAAGNIAANSLATMVYDVTLDKVIWTSVGLSPAVPIEIQVALANAVGCDLWYNFPHLCEDAYVTSTVAYVRDNLVFGLNAYFEYSNETWNFIFTQTPYCAAIGAAAGIPNASNRREFYGHALRHRQIMGLAASTWGAARYAASLKRVMAFQLFGATTNNNTYRFKGTDLGAFGYDVAPNRPVDYSDVLSYATYYEGEQAQGFQTNYGGVTAVGAITGGSGYVNGSYSSVSLTGGTGNSARANITVSGGAVTVVTLTAEGRLYVVGDTLSASNANLGGSGSGFSVPVSVTIGGLTGAADDYASGNPTLMASALTFVDNDMRGPNLGNQTLNALTTLYVGWETVNTANNYNLPLVCYEGGFEAIAPTAATCTALGISTNYATSIATLLAAYKRSSLFYQLVLDQFSQFLAQLHSTTPTWYLLFPSSQWSAFEGDLYSTKFQSWFAMLDFNAEAGVSIRHFTISGVHIVAVPMVSGY